MSKRIIARVTNHNPIDVYVGKRARLRRTLIGMSQMQVADKLGITFQQVQKYERGSNRISASRLYDLSVILGVSVTFFYDQMDENTKASSPAAVLREAEGGNVVPLEPVVKDAMARRETLELVRAFYEIRESAVRKRITDLVKSFANTLGQTQTLSIDTAVDPEDAAAAMAKIA